MKAWRDCRCLGASVVTVSMLVFAGPASAKGGHEVELGGFGASFQLRGTKGYHLSVRANGHRLVTLSATRGDSSANYTVPGRASRNGIHARFGSLGRISVRFEGSPVRRRGREGSCKGRQTIREAGAFRGTIRFEGERDFTEVDAQRAKGGFYRSFRRVCRKRSWKPDFDIPEEKSSNKRFRSLMTAFIAESRVHGRDTGLAIVEVEAALGPRESESLFLSFVIAAQEERVGKMAIARSLFTEGSRGSLLASEPGARPVLATVALPKPFFGTATYRQDAGLPPSWTGPLAVRLPGTEAIPLTGEDFKAGLCHDTREKQFFACLRKLSGAFGGDESVAVAQRLAQGSGSQSQAFWDARLSWSR
jgi:hypothetical protein